MRDYKPKYYSVTAWVYPNVNYPTLSENISIPGSFVRIEDLFAELYRMKTSRILSNKESCDGLIHFSIVASLEAGKSILLVGEL